MLLPSTQMTSAFRNVFALGDGFLVDHPYLQVQKASHDLAIVCLSTLAQYCIIVLAHSSCIFVKPDVPIPDLSLLAPFTYSALSQVVLYLLIF